MQIPILKGVYADGRPDLRASLPVNMVPVVMDSGLSSGYLRTFDGITQAATGPGTDRGGILWDGVMYRVMGPKFVSISDANVITTIGTVADDASPVTMVYSFDRIGIASGGNLYYYNGTTLSQVTDGNLGTVLDVTWVDGYFLTTDGVNLVVTELNDPTSVDPLKYGSSEIDPDQIVAVEKLRNEVYAVNRFTIEVFDNIGGTTFPFQRIEGAQITKGATGTHAVCIFADSIAFLGSGRNESVGVHLGANGQSVKISTHDVDMILEGYTEAQLATVQLEQVILSGQALLMVHLPDRTLVYNGTASLDTQSHIWTVLVSATGGFSKFKGRNFIYAYGRWYCGDPDSSKIGYIDSSLGGHWGATVRWEFSSPIIHAEGRGAILHEVEISCLPGRSAFGISPQVSTAYSLDGMSWSQERFINAGGFGERLKRLVWFGQGAIRNWRIQRFSGDSDCRLAVARLDIRPEPVAF